MTAISKSGYLYQLLWYNSVSKDIKKAYVHLDRTVQVLGVSMTFLDDMSRV